MEEVWIETLEGRDKGREGHSRGKTWSRTAWYVSKGEGMDPFLTSSE